MRISWSGKGQSGRGSPKGGRRRWRLLLVPAVGIAFVCQLSLVGTAAASVTSATTPAAPTVAPKPSNELDCNGWSPAYKAVKKLAGDLCTDPIKVIDGNCVDIDGKLIPVSREHRQDVFGGT